MEKITRRTALLWVIPTIGTAAIAPAMGEPLDTDAELFRLMEEWRTQYDVVCKDTTDYQNVADDVPLARLRAIEAAVAETRPASVEGFAAKLLVMTNFGDFDLDGPAECMIADARAISGFQPPASMRAL